MSAEIPAEAFQLRSLVRADQTLELFLDMVPVSEPGRSYTAQVSLPGALSLEAIADYGRQATGSKYVIIPSRAA